MATARKTANVGSSGQIEIIITDGTQSTSNNTTQVRVRGVMHNSAGRVYDSSSDGVTRRISGEDSWNSTFNYDIASSASYTFIDQTFTVPHASNGTKTVSYTIHLGSSLSSTFGSGGSVGTSLALPAIDRQPGAPGRPSISAVSPGTVSATWTAAATNGSSIDEYQIVWSKYSDFRTLAGNLRDSTSRTRTISGLDLLTDYFFRVRAHNSQGWGPYSTSRQFYTPTVPSKGVAPTLTHSSGTTLNASWGASSINGTAITNYELQVDDNSSFSSPSVVNKGTTRSHAISDATMGKTWYVRVRAENAMGSGAWSDTRSFAVPTVPDAVPALTVTYSPPDTITVSWSVPGTGGTPITGYEFQQSKSSTFSGAVTVTGTTRSVTLDSLDVGDTYYFRVRAVNKQGVGAWSPTSEKLVVSGPKIRDEGVWRNSIVWVKHAGVWRIATPFIRHGGVWRIGGG